MKYYKSNFQHVKKAEMSIHAKLLLQAGLEFHFFSHKINLSCGV